MNILWAPWREVYVVKVSKQPKTGCVFCGILKEKKDRKNFIFCRTEHSFAVLNIYPFNGGHALAIPKRHVDDLDQLSAEELKDLMDLVLSVKKMMKKALDAEGFNIGVNLGHVAGAGMPEHVHIHIVPRWKGDANFMPVIGGTKVIPVSLAKLHKRFVDAHKA